MMKKTHLDWKKILFINIINFIILVLYVIWKSVTNNNGWLSNLITIFSFIFFVSLISSFLLSHYFTNFKEKIIHGIFTPLTLILITFISISSIEGNISQPFLDQLFMIFVIAIIAYAGTFIGIIINQVFSYITESRK